MKIFNHAAVLLLMILLVMAVLPQAVFAEKADMRYGKQQLSAMPNGESLQYVYDCFVAGCESAQTEINIDLTVADINFDDIKLVYNLFYNDYPEYFWIDGAWDGSSLGNNMTITPAYALTGDQLNAAKTEFDNKVNSLTAGLSGKSDYEKSKTLHDLLIDNSDYVSGENDQTAYGALVEGKAVCNGYAKAYQCLLQKVGIPAWFVVGKSYNPTTKEHDDHSWNMLCLDGEWYYTDVTWDDQGENTFYTYFNTTTDMLSESHTPDAEYTDYLPEATATEANFYIKEGLTFDTFDQEKLVDLLKKCNNKTHLYINGNLTDFETEFEAKVQDISIKLGGNGGYNYKINNLGRGWILDININNTDNAVTSESQNSSTVSTPETNENSSQIDTPNGAVTNTPSDGQTSSDTSAQNQVESNHENNSTIEAVSSNGDANTNSSTPPKRPSLAEPSDSTQQATDTTTSVEDTEISDPDTENYGILNNTLKWIIIGAFSILLIAGIAVMALKRR